MSITDLPAAGSEAVHFARVCLVLTIKPKSKLASGVLCQRPRTGVLSVPPGRKIQIWIIVCDLDYRIGARHRRGWGVKCVVEIESGARVADADIDFMLSVGNVWGVAQHDRVLAASNVDAGRVAEESSVKEALPCRGGFAVVAI